MDIQLHYREKGTGAPLVLLHGNGEDLTYFTHQVEYFSRFYRVIALDTRGHGRSPRGTAPFTISQFAEDLKRFLEEKGIPKAHILGFSDGGNIALTFALRYPDRVDHLILNGANLFPTGMKFSVWLSVVLEYLVSWLTGNREKQALMALMTEEPRFKPEDLQVLAVPTLVIAGDRDMIKDSHTRLIARHISNSRLVILPGDHFIASNQAAAFNAAVEAFLAGKI